ncbi:glycine/betaine ABC transporter glycine/betaine-binding protein OpuAC [Actinobaculum suis]|uniref:Glycine/betaine ABC transporter glycine/betaine-binding protein OpuAC n=1 Tax=Actinobaculum suis TaxID=1657 RepID=A0A7Z8Y8G9_9ACTO|nr:glycine betaine ABC transporter substrate-binding protein [Actinobaculum suis]VDG76209.1 glycine/betaine ABC transporter glycine/betaine-binding protein OpuAC [Actinobaculum suis]
MTTHVSIPVHSSPAGQIVSRELATRQLASREHTSQKAAARQAFSQGDAGPASTLDDASRGAGARPRGRVRTLLARMLLALACTLGLVGCSLGEHSADAISVGVPTGWDEGVVVSAMFAQALEEQGYTVRLTDADVGLIFAALSKGDMDLLLDVWLPNTHENYLERYGDSIESLGVWYDDARLAITVNNDAPVESIADLKDNAGIFGNQIIGIDGGAGITRVVQEDAIPQYDLDGVMPLKTSSTAAMLAELDGAMKKGEDIAVTLWTPHWAYGAYDIRNLEDPLGAMGDSEELHAFGRTGFAEDRPEIAAMLAELELTEEELADAENYVLNENKDLDRMDAIKAWFADNPETRAKFDVNKS